MNQALRQLIEAGYLDEHEPDASEVEGLLGIASRRIEEADGSLKYPDSIFTLAYDAVRCLATVVIRAEGLRARQGRHHEMTFEALRRLGITGLSDRASYYDACRRKRAKLEYDSAGDVSEKEARELGQEATRLDSTVRSWLTKRHPHLASRGGNR